MLGLVTSDGGRRFFLVRSLRIEMSNFNQRDHQFYSFVITIWTPPPFPLNEPRTATGSQLFRTLLAFTLPDYIVKYPFTITDDWLENLKRPTSWKAKSSLPVSAHGSGRSHKALYCKLLKWGLKQMRRYCRALSRSRFSASFQYQGERKFVIPCSGER